MKSSNLVLGFFHECGADGTYTNHIDDFRRANGGYVLLKTEDTEVWAFYGQNSDSDLENAWRKWLGNGCRATFFEMIDASKEWAETWAERIPVMLKTVVES